jgi:putative membrane protein
MFILKEYLFTFGWSLVGALSMAVAFLVMMKVFNKLTPFNEWEEIKKGNIAVAITIASVIISAALVIGKAIG